MGNQFGKTRTKRTAISRFFPLMRLSVVLRFLSDAVFLGGFIMSLVSCDFYKSVGEMDSYNFKTTMKPCTELNAPVIIFEDVDENLYFNGNQDAGFLIENRGAAIYVYDWENDSVFDWIFIPTKKGLRKRQESGNGRYITMTEDLLPKCTYVFDTQTSLTKKYDSDFFDYLSFGGDDYSYVCNSEPLTSEFLFMMDKNLKIFDAANGSVKNVASLKDVDFFSFDVCYKNDGLAYFIYHPYNSMQTEISPDVTTDYHCIVVDLENAKVIKEFPLPIYKKLEKTSKKWYISTDCKGLFENYIVTSNTYVDNSTDINIYGPRWLYFYDLTGTKDLQIPIVNEEKGDNGDTIYYNYIFIETPGQNYIIKNTHYPNSKTEFFTLNPETESLDFDFEADINISSNIKMSGNKLITWKKSYLDGAISCQTFDFSTKNASELHSFSLSDVRKKTMQRK